MVVNNILISMNKERENTAKYLLYFSPIFVYFKDH